MGLLEIVKCIGFAVFSISIVLYAFSTTEKTNTRFLVMTCVGFALLLSCQAMVFFQGDEIEDTIRQNIAIELQTEPDRVVITKETTNENIREVYCDGVQYIVELDGENVKAFSPI